MIKNVSLSMARIIIRQIRGKLEAPICSKLFLYLFFLNIISNLSSLKYQFSPLYLIEIISLSSLIAYFESTVYWLVTNKKLGRIYAFLISCLHILLIMVEYFLLINFKKNLNQDVIDILGETNPEESKEFFATYLSSMTIFLYFVAATLCCFALYTITKYIYKIKNFKYVCALFISFGFCTLGYCVYNFVLYKDGKSIPQLTTLTRGGYALYVMNHNLIQIDNICRVCKDLTVTQEISKKPTIVVIIGESHSLQHSSLYGYNKCTNPLLEKLAKEGSLIVYDNATCVETFTTASLKADYSLDSLGINYDNIALFPACFKKAGYHTELWDNQYFAGQGINFISNCDLSHVLFDVRNNKQYKYDENMINNIKVMNTPSLYIIHLWGQHYTYTDRYPSSFEKFTANQYNKKYKESARQKMAEYDNACLYNDFVINSIINKFKDQYCCIFYFSDHGEEVYELRNFMGHGDGEASPDIRYQTNIPLLVWMSDEFNKNYKATFEKAIHYPISMDDIGHSIIDAAGIRCKDFVESRSFLSQHYNTNRRRIVMHTIDYDLKIKEQPHIIYK